MWIFTETGFVSAVQKKPTDTTLEVRARDKESLAPFVDQGFDIVTRDHSDYPFRVIVPHAAFAEFAQQAALKIDYSNFKNRITQTRGRVWHDALMDVWVAGLKLTPRKKKGSRYGEPRGNKYSRSIDELMAVNGGGYPVPKTRRRDRGKPEGAR